MIYVRTRRRKLEVHLRGSSMHLIGRLKREKIRKSTFRSGITMPLFVVSGTKRSALINCNLEGFKDMCQDLQ